MSELRLTMFAEDSLAPAEKWLVEAHVRDCAECREFLNGNAVVDSLIRGAVANELAVPTPTSSRILESVERKQFGLLYELRRVSRLMPAAAGSCVAALLVVIALGLTHQAQQPQYQSSRPVTHIRRGPVRPFAPSPLGRPGSEGAVPSEVSNTGFARIAAESHGTSSGPGKVVVNESPT